MAILIFLANSLPAQTRLRAVAAVDIVIQRALNRAATEDDNDREFNQHYSYTRVRLTEYRNAKGELKKHEEKRTAEGVTNGNADPRRCRVAAPKPAETKDAAAFRYAFQHSRQGASGEGLFADESGEVVFNSR